MILKPEWYTIAYYDGGSNKCIDEDKYYNFEEAHKYYQEYNSKPKVGNDYVQLYAYIKNLGLIKMK